MGVNEYKDHILVLPEDDANRQIANGFSLDPSLNSRAIHILPIAKGWGKALGKFDKQYIDRLRRFQKCHLVILIDFDGKFDDRIEHIKGLIPNDICDRVYLLGASCEPEQLRTACHLHLEEIGEKLADACANNDADSLWGHDHLKHNKPELDRLHVNVKDFLFHR